MNTGQNLEIFKITSKNLITKSDCNINYNKQQIRVILSDSENNIFYYLYEMNNISNKKDDKIKLIGIYDFLFLYKITDIKFLNVKNFDEEQDNLFYFLASSRDGLLYILNNLGDIIFQHKTNQTWITQSEYDSLHNILFFLTNFDDKIVGAKFNVNKDPIIKRIPKTNNPYCCQLTTYMDKFIYLDANNNLYYLNTFFIDDMFKTFKLKKRNEYNPILLYHMNNDDIKPEFMNKFKIITNKNKINCNNKDDIIIILMYNNEIKFIYI